MSSEEYVELSGRLRVLESIFIPKYKNDKGTHPYFEILCNIANKNYGITKDQIKSQTRKREICDVRFMMMNILEDSTNLTPRRIGQIFGGRDHATFYNAKHKHADFLDNNAEYRVQFQDLRREFNNITEVFKRNIY